MTRTFTCGIVLSRRSASENLHHGAATRVAGSLDDLAFNFTRNQKLQSNQLFAETGQGHQQFGCFRPAHAQRQLRWSVSFQDEDPSWLETQHSFCVNLASQEWRQVSKYRGDPRPRARGDVIVLEVSDHGFDLHPSRFGEPLGLGQPNFRLIDCRHTIALEGEMNRIVSLAFGQAQHRSGRNLRRDLRQESVGLLAIKMAGASVAVIPEGCVHNEQRSSITHLVEFHLASGNPVNANRVSEHNRHPNEGDGEHDPESLL